MSQFSFEVRNAIAWVTFDSGGMNTLSAAAIRDLKTLIGDIRSRHRATPLLGVIMRGNRFGLGAGANINELLAGTRAQLEELIDEGHAQLFAIEEGDDQVFTFSLDEPAVYEMESHELGVVIVKFQIS